ncbi:MAG: hypothetical protein M3517_10475, partial [Actinomycetota bacterium]|nr:hypothetical protein [Actinomycetota bacterium]
VQPGDEVTVEVEGLGALTNRIVTGPTAIRTDVGAQPSESEEVRSTALGGDWEHRGERAPEGPGAQHYQSQVGWARDLDHDAAGEAPGGAAVPEREIDPGTGGHPRE